ncbi:hypothetical protein LTR37_013518 [Vermiconidia calcicola]|uniref:Uncharacterized protein n=1 Tax=Vermiconidia calcicola TaxID=1690605 RepID=A0ACC3MXT0_9PEZI|nr:hypothetical protein LTR37_013518 [Vermiconidia calcicola]
MSSVIPVPDEKINFVPIRAGETFKLGPMTCRIMEDGSKTGHEMHDETFFITQGTIRFHVPDPSRPGEDKDVIDAKAGDYMVVPIRAPHTFSNPSNEEARIFFTSTPSFYINYFKLLSQLSKPDEPLPGEVTMRAMSMFATIQVDQKPRLVR